MNINTREWYIKAPWGKIAMISWGNPTSSKVLLVHGRQDSIASFKPLVELLPDKYYVGFDLPGHGKSDPLPIGFAIARIHFVGTVDMVVKYLQWDKFTMIGHSMGAELALIYNVAYPGKIKNLILLDPGPSLQRMHVHDPVEYYKMFYASYYDNYKAYNVDDRVYTKENAMKAVMRARKLNENQAEIVLSRNLKEIGDGQYRLSWDKRIRMPAALNNPSSYYLQLFSMNLPRTLIIAASNSESTVGYDKSRVIVQELIENWQKAVKHLKVVNMEGGHDVHLTNPERVAPLLEKFMVDSVMSKL